MLEPNEKDITFLTSVNNQNTHQLDSNQEAKSEPIYHEGTETENTFKSSIQHSFLLKPMTKDSDGRAQK